MFTFEFHRPKNSKSENGSGSIQVAQLCKPTGGFWPYLQGGNLWPGQDGNIWAKSDNFNLAPGEANQCVNAFTNPNVLPSAGISIEGQQFPIMQKPENTGNTCLFGMNDHNGVTVARTARGFLVSVSEEPELGRSETVGMAQQLANQYGW